MGCIKSKPYYKYVDINHQELRCDSSGNDIFIIFTSAGKFYISKSDYNIINYTITSDIRYKLYITGKYAVIKDRVWPNGRSVSKYYDYEYD